MILIDIIGQKFGRLTVVSRSENDPRGNARWLCRCNCGVEKVVLAQSLRKGATVSCGCFNTQRPRPTKHGASGTKLYGAWVGMIQRCTNPKHEKWPRYGGSGITVCERWRSFENFLADMGDRPAGKTLDRWPNQSGNYEPGNCRWATLLEQASNRRDNVIVSVDGRDMTASEASRLLGASRSLVSRRMRDGWTADQALSTKFRQYKRSAS